MRADPARLAAHRAKDAARQRERRRQRQQAAMPATRDTTQGGLNGWCEVCGAEATEAFCVRCTAVLKAFNYDPVRMRKAAAILEKYNRVQRPDGSADLLPKTGGD